MITGLFLYDNILSGTLLQASAWVLIPLGLTNITSGLLNSLGLENKSFVHFVIGSIVMFMALWFLPPIFGINALIWAMGLNYLITAVLNMILLKKKTNSDFKIMQSLIKIILLIIPSSALTAFVVSLCDYVFPLFITLVIGGIISVGSYVLLAGVLNLFDVKGFFVKIVKKLKPIKLKTKTAK